jgi:hypothetical protein
MFVVKPKPKVIALEKDIYIMDMALDVRSCLL